MPPHSEQIVSRICGALFRGSLVGIKSSKASGTAALVGGAACEAAGTVVGSKIAGNGPAAHYMVKIRFDDKSMVVVSKPSTEVAGLAVGSRVTVSGSGADMNIAAE
ncbi:hypothetical protein BRN33_21600 [Xanthomonas oryzae pv. oryzae]|nr:hypothetical protein BRN33_21600 [Xanthomonas oryzae pv. oryzae]RBL22089.1 hypothetical protein BRN31_22280 [Xanthomonas oryzae pv. oryzae]RBL53229.1 hypothetical protein BRN24_19070 [Xanthomonas oryzae pv. oryzae]